MNYDALDDIETYSYLKKLKRLCLLCELIEHLNKKIQKTLYRMDDSFSIFISANRNESESEIDFMNELKFISIEFKKSIENEYYLSEADLDELNKHIGGYSDRCNKTKKFRERMFMAHQEERKLFYKHFSDRKVLIKEFLNLYHALSMPNKLIEYLKYKKSN